MGNKTKLTGFNYFINTNVFEYLPVFGLYFDFYVSREGNIAIVIYIDNFH